MRKFERKSVRFRLYSLFTLITLVTMLFVSCAGGTSSADGDVGYLTFGSSRALGLSYFSDIDEMRVDNLTDLELKGTRNGRTTTLKTWSSYSQIPGTAVSVQAGNWTFELSGTISYSNGTTDTLFTSEANAVIKAGEDTSVTFTMTYAGYPVRQAYTGDIILSNGYCIPAALYSSCSELVAKYPPEAVAVWIGDNSTPGGVYNVYGVHKDIKVNVNYNIAGQNSPAGWSLPSPVFMSGIDYAELMEGFAVLGSASLFPSNWFWTSEVSAPGYPTVYSFSNSDSDIQADSSSLSAIYVKQYY